MYKCFSGTVAIIGFLILTTPAEAVTTFQRTYGSTGWFNGRSVQETQDGGYVIAGATTSFDADSMAVFIVKTDSQGNTSLQIADFGWREGTHPMLDGMEFVSIPSGKFMMGSSSSESGRSPNESQHRVYIDSFELMTTEVT